MERIDGVFRDAYPPSGPGAAVIVVQDGKTVLRRGYGLANAELGVAIRPEMVFRVGSATKQFTSACVLRLVEQGKLRLDDPVGKYLPDYPAAGRAVRSARSSRYRGSKMWSGSSAPGNRTVLRGNRGSWVLTQGV